MTSLQSCKLGVANGHETFARHMARLADNAPDTRLTTRQAEQITRLAWRYRRQMPPHLVPAQDPDTLSQSNVTEDPEDQSQEEA